tara:strand:- start:62 stop:1321 length:1260 start_codon:yes stop_codon:yes gene_type:complete
MNHIIANRKYKIHPSVPMDLLIEINNIASKLRIYRVAIVGGSIRDSILFYLRHGDLDTPNDIDLLIEGSASQLTQEIIFVFGDDRVQRVTVYEKFNTAEIEIDNYKIDIAGARLEEYPKAGENPKVTPTSLEKDLRRRDFNANSIAFEISTKKLIDLYQGEEDIKLNKLIFIHSKSVEEDPTRIIRGARYAAKLNFKLDKNSINQIKSAIKEWPWEYKPGESNRITPSALGIRMKREIELLLSQKEWKLGITYLQEWGALKLLDKDIQNDIKWEKRISLALKFKLPPLIALICCSYNSIDLAKRLELPINQQKIISQTKEFDDWMSLKRNDSPNLWSASTWCKELERSKWNIEVIELSICKEINNWEILYKWFTQWRHIKSPINARELIKRGWKEGRSLGIELDRIRLDYIDSISENRN